MDLHQLEIFLAVIDTGSVSKAAEAVHLSPGAVSLQLQNLAGSLNTELFLRSGRRLVPTSSAHQLAEYSRPLLHQMRHIERAFANDADADTRPFRFATGVTTLIYRLAGPLRKLRRQYPNTEIQVSVSVTEDIVQGLMDRRYDLGVISLPLEKPSTDGLDIIPLYEEELLVLRPSSVRVRYSHVHSIAPEDLDGVPFLMYPGNSNMRSLIDQHLERLGIRPRVVMEADTETIKGLVEAGFGCAMLPEHALRGQSRFFQLLRIGNHRLIRKQALAMPKTNYPRMLTSRIAEFLEAALAGNKPEEPTALEFPEMPAVEVSDAPSAIRQEMTGAQS